MDEGRPITPPLHKPGAIAEQLSRGQQVEGIVTKITEFGAFVDIGVGRDGMIHISELQLSPVEKVSDVVQPGQHIVAWVKEVNLQKSRIGLTMVDPTRKKIRELEVGAPVKGVVTRLTPYAAFVDIGAEREAMLHVKEMGRDYVKNPGQVVSPGDEVEARILAVDRRRRRVDLTMKPEEESEPVQVETIVAKELAEPAQTTQEDDDHIPTMMELALREAMERAKERDRKSRKRKDQPSEEEMRSEQDEIISRTLELHRQEQ